MSLSSNFADKDIIRFGLLKNTENKWRGRPLDHCPCLDTFDILWLSLRLDPIDIIRRGCAVSYDYEVRTCMNNNP